MKACDSVWQEVLYNIVTESSMPTKLVSLINFCLNGTYSTGCLQMNGAVSKVNRKFISHLTRAKRTPSAAATVQVLHTLPAIRFSFLLRVRRVSLQDGAAAGKGFLCAPF